MEMQRLTQKEFDHYYSQTDPREPKPVREIHAIRKSLSDRKRQGKVSPMDKEKTSDFLARYNIKSVQYA